MAFEVERSSHLLEGGRSNLSRRPQVVKKVVVCVFLFVDCLFLFLTRCLSKTNNHHITRPHVMVLYWVIAYESQF